MQQGIEKGYIRDCEPTLNGQTYLSASFIQQQTIDHLHQNKGRTTLTRLAELLNLPVDTLERYLTYLDELKQTCMGRMEEQGFLSLVAQTQATSLPYRLLQKVLDVDTMDHCIQYSGISDLIFTRTYVNQQKHQIVDHLQSSTEPLAMQKLQKETSISDGVFYLFLEQIIKEHTLQGAFRGRRERAIFIPHVYRDTQLAMIDSLLKAGNYIEYHTIEQLYGFAAPKDLLQKLDLNIILLDTCAVTESITSPIEDTLLSASSDFSWLDVSHLLPSSLSLADITTLLESILPRLNNNNNNNRRKKKSTRAPSPSSETRTLYHFILLGKYVTTTRYLETNVIEAAQPFLNQRATMELTKNQKFLHSNKGKRKKDLQVVLTNEEIQAHLVEEQGLPLEFATLVTTKIKRSMMEGMDYAMKKVYINADTTKMVSGDGTSWLDRQQQHLKLLLADLRLKIYYNMQSIALFEDPSTRKSMEKYMVRQYCGDFMFYLVLIITLWQSKDQSEMTTLTGLHTKDIEQPEQVDDTQASQVIAALVSSDTTWQKELIPLHQGYQGGKKMDAFNSFITASSSPLATKLGWADLDNQENQRQYNMEFWKNLQRQLESTPVSESTAPSILHLTLLLCFQTIYHLPLNVSGKYVPSILNTLAPKLQGGILNVSLEQLKKAQHSIMAGMKSGAIDLDLIGTIRQLGLDLCNSKP
ncbi:hypothetical protein BC941DRAFT_467007 [Chlamydoabsidia padenii]|nr:hypothetical protein BC941DRAFT_467007 [Chlamydoabsidia padenii]